MKAKILSNENLAFFCEQLAMLLPAGITPFDAVTLMLEDTDSDSKSGNEFLIDLKNSLNDGVSFSEALKKTEVFPAYMIEMILLGEESGNLDIIVKKLSDYYKQQCDISDSIKNAIFYPLIMLGLMLLIFIVLLTKILPIFNEVFRQLGSSLTGIAGYMLNIGTKIRSLSIILFFVLLVLAGFIFYFRTNTQGQKKFYHFLQNFRLTQNIFLYLNYSKFAGALSIITAAGLDIFYGIQLSQSLIYHEKLNDKINLCLKELQNGDYLYEAMKKAGIFHPAQLRMLQIGHRSGNTDEILSKISNYYEDKALKKIQNVLSSIEPTLVIIFSFLVGFILLSVIMPLIGIMSNLGG